MIACTAATVPTSTENFHGFSRWRHSCPGRLRERQYPAAPATMPTSSTATAATMPTERPPQSGQTLPAKRNRAMRPVTPAAKAPASRASDSTASRRRGGASAVVFTAGDAVMAGSYARRPPWGERSFMCRVVRARSRSAGRA